MGKSKGSLKGYEFSNLLFFLGLMVVLGGICWLVLYHIGTRDRQQVVIVEPGISQEATSGDIALFYLEGFQIVGTERTYRSRLEIPATDDGFIRGLFDIPGVEELTIRPQLVMVRKNGDVSWDRIRGSIREVINNHLHSHY
jgi:hypothetical protein